MDGAAIASSLVGKTMAEALSDAQLRTELIRLAPQLANDIRDAPIEALREAALEITGGATITSASYSPKKKRVQLTVKGMGPGKHATYHIPLRALEVA